MKGVRTYTATVPRGRARPFKIEYLPATDGFKILSANIDGCPDVLDLVHELPYGRILDLFLDSCIEHYEGREGQPRQATTKNN